MKDKGDLRVHQGGMASGLPFGWFKLLQRTPACHVPWKNLRLLLQGSSSGRQVAVWQRGGGRASSRADFRKRSPLKLL